MLTTRTLRALPTAAALITAAAVAGPAFAAGHALKPAIASFTPTTAKPTAVVTVLGSNLTGAKIVKIDGMSAKFKVLSAKKLTVTLPSKAKSGKIAVTTTGGTATSFLTLKVG